MLCGSHFYNSVYDILSCFSFRDSILYLEWAPSNILCQDPVPSDDSKDVAIKNPETKEVLLEQQLEEMNQVEFDSEGAEVECIIFLCPVYAVFTLRSLINYLDPQSVLLLYLLHLLTIHQIY